MYSFHHHHSLVLTKIPVPTKFRFNVGQCCIPVLVQCWSIVYDAGPTLIYHRVCFILCANTWHSTNAVLMLTHSRRRWPVMKQHWVIVQCFLTAALCWWRFNIPAPETPDNTIHWPNADVMLGHRLQRWANIIPTKTIQALNRKNNRDFFFWTLVKDKSTKPKNLYPTVTLFPLSRKQTQTK